MATEPNPFEKAIDDAGGPEVCFAPETTFSKFDRLGAALSELSFDCISLHFSRYTTGHDGFTVYLHATFDQCVAGDGVTASEALEVALHRLAKQQADRVEAAAGRELAA